MPTTTGRPKQQTFQIPKTASSNPTPIPQVRIQPQAQPQIQPRDVRTAPRIENTRANSARRTASPRRNRRTTPGIDTDNMPDVVDDATARMAEQLGYYFGGVLTGLEGRIVPFNEDSLFPEKDAPYSFGTYHGKQLRNSIRDSLKQVPSFEIPQVKIPELKLPQLPKVELPKLPEIKVPELPKFPELPRIALPKLSQTKIPRLPNPFPKIPSLKPTPVPKPRPYTPGRLIDKLEREDMSQCGGFVIYGVDVRRVIIFNDGSPTIDTSFPMEEYIRIRDTYVRNNLDPNHKGFTPFNLFANLEGAFTIINGYRVDIGGSSRLNMDGGLDWKFGSPALAFRSFGVTIRENNFKVSDVVRALKSVFPDGEIYHFQTSSDAPECRLPEPLPPTIPPNPPKKEKDCCMCNNCDQTEEMMKLILRRIGVLPMQVTLDNKPKQIESLATGIKEIIELPKDEAIASLPLSFQIRHEGRTPQLVIQCAEQYRDTDGRIQYKSAMYPVTVPHWSGGPNDRPRLPTYKKGNWEGIYVLNDNSKVTINAADEANCIRILNAIKPWIPKEFQKGAYFKGGKIDVEIKGTVVKPMYGRYFSQGQKKGKPDWRVDFP